MKISLINFFFNFTSHFLKHTFLEPQKLCYILVVIVEQLITRVNATRGINIWFEFIILITAFFTIKVQQFEEKKMWILSWSQTQQSIHSLPVL